MAEIRKKNANRDTFSDIFDFNISLNLHLHLLRPFFKLLLTSDFFLHYIPDILFKLNQYDICVHRQL